MNEREVPRCLADVDISPEVRRVFAMRLNFLLEKRGVSQRQLSNATGISPSSISRMASGQRTVTGDALAKICLALEADASWLLGLPTSGPAARMRPPRSRDPDTNRKESKR